MKETAPESVEVIEDGNALAVTFQPAVITADFEAMARKLDELLEPYDGATREGLEHYSAKELKPFRAELNKMSKALNAARIAVKKQYTAPLAAFEARIKELDERIQEPCRLIDEVVKEKEQTEREERRRYLEDWYLDFCEANGVTALAECVPFERILKKEWLNKSTQLGKATAELDEALEKVLTDYQAVTNSTYYDEETAMQTFFETLSMAEVVKRDLAKREAAEKAAALKAEIEGNRQSYTPSTENTPENGSEQPQTREYSFTVRCTEAQRDALVAWFKANGITGSFKAVRDEV